MKYIDIPILVLFIVILLYANKSGIGIITYTQIIFFSTKKQVRAAPEQDKLNTTYKRTNSNSLIGYGVRCSGLSA
jgi:hypothetical protein